LESFETEKENGFEDLDSEGLGLQEVDGGPVDSEDAFS
jgi:hypothetical protein